MHARFGRALAYRLSALSTRRYTVSLAATSEAIMKAITRGNQIGTHQPQSRAIREALRAARTSSRADTDPRAVMSRWMVRAWPRVTAKWSGVWCDRSRHSTWAFASSRGIHAPPRRLLHQCCGASQIRQSRTTPLWLKKAAMCSAVAPPKLSACDCGGNQSQMREAIPN